MADTPPIAFVLAEFNPRRAARGASAASVRVVEGDWSDTLWMSQRDIRGNIDLHGAHPELVRALNAYKAGREIRDGVEVTK